MSGNDRMEITEDESYLPRWISDTNIDPKWIEEVTNLKGVTQCAVQDISNATRKGETIRNGATLKLLISFAASKDKPPLSLIIKQIPNAAGRAQSRMLGLAREAHFYNHLAPKILGETGRQIIPKIYHAHGDMKQGSKLVLMEDLSPPSTDDADDKETFLDSGILFGPGNPNNWSRNLPERIAQAYPPPRSAPSSQQVATETFRAIAKVHAKFWQDHSLLEHHHEWLRCAQWIQGQDQSSWEASQGYVRGIWEGLRDAKKVDSVLQWNPLVKELTQKAIDGISWEAQLERLNCNSNKKCHWTLVHGDCWPGNVLVSTKDLGTLKLLDWEMVGVGSGPQDLGQYILSNMDPKERRPCEEELIRSYHHELLANGVEGFSWDECWREYKVGGLERWLWFLVYFCGQEGPLLKWAQFFHDQIAAFVLDHSLTVDMITQVRP